MTTHYHPCNAKACEPSGTSVADLVAEERERIVAWLLKTDRWVAAEDVARGAHMEEQ